MLLVMCLVGCGGQTSSALDGSVGDGASDAGAEGRGARPDDCVFPSGRICKANADCPDDVACNGCTCSGGMLSCTEVNCGEIPDAAPCT